MRERGSFGRAAEARLHAVGREPADRDARRIIGERLVDRPGGPRAVSLTEAGTLLLRHAEAIIARLEAARADMVSLQAGETGSLRLAPIRASAHACSPR